MVSKLLVNNILRTTLSGYIKLTQTKGKTDLKHGADMFKMCSAGEV